ncbi:hypothetical protein BSKO_03368 [Bryopsis sp. KO-2023]|nr:hypothetical protein BSKO_03368 [Bryopsis sp. KO-2023]
MSHTQPAPDSTHNLSRDKISMQPAQQQPHRLASLNSNSLGPYRSMMTSHASRLGGGALGGQATLPLNRGANANPTSGDAPTGAGIPKPSAAPPGHGGAAGPSTGAAQPLYRSADAAPAVKRTRKRKAQDRNLHPRVEHFVPESKVYNQLLEYEKRLDTIIDTRKAEIQEAIQAPERVSKRLRVYLHNTYENQATSENRREDEPPCWSLKISGRVVDTGWEGVGKDGERSGRDDNPSFSTFLKRLHVQLDPELYPGDKEKVTWEKSRGDEGRDTFEVRRIGDKDVKVKVALELDSQVPKYTLSPAMASLLGLETATRARILNSLWAYIFVNKLQVPDDPATIECNEKFKNLFGGAQTISISTLSQRLGPHLAPCEAIHLDHTVKVSGVNPSHPTAYDIDVELPSTPNVEHLASFLERINKDKDIAGLDHKISAAIKKIDEHRRRRAFFLGFGHSPVDFINSVLVSQSKDLRDARASGGQDFEVERRTDIFKGAWVEDAVVKYLQRRLAGGN